MENYHVWLVVGIMGLLSAFYAIPWIGNRTLRDFPTLKLLTVVVCWMLVLFALPEYSISAPKAVFTDDNGYNNRILLTQVSSVFFFIYALCIPFEIRDLHYDREDLQTLPQKIGVHKTKILGIVLLLISFSIDWLGDYHVYFYPIPKINLPFSITIGITILAIWFSDKVKSDYYASFFVEAIPILWLGLYWVF
ncbi:MAG: hypothetical protein ACSHWW_08450 [Nonlabens sp.]|uniref:hypothetical protein n=1 Tax=Nonlabens sp. TaxID=1888209 RepID=UPI003EF2B7F2